MKKVLIGTVVVLILLLLCAVLAPFIVNLDKYKDTILAQLEPYVPRDVDFQHVELTLLTGVGAEVQGLRISENPQFGGGDFLQLKTLKVRIQILPLLKGEIKVNRIILDQPVVHLIRNAQGVFNVDDLAGEEAEGAAGEPAPDATVAPEEVDANAGPGVLAWLLVNDLDVRNGTVTYRDETLFPEAPPLVLGALDLTAKDLSLSKPVTLNLDAGVFQTSGQNLHLTGVVGPAGDPLVVEGIPFQLSCKLDPLPWQAVPEAVRNRALDGTPYRLLSGSLRLDLEADGALQAGIRTRSEWHLDDGVLQKSVAEGSGAATGRVELILTEEALLNHPARTLEIVSAEVSLNGNRLRLQGRVEDYMEAPRWDLDLRTVKLEPNTLITLLPVFGAGIPEELQMEGPVSVQFHSDGSLDKLRFDVNADMNQLKVQYGDSFQKAVGTPCSLIGNGTREGDRLTLKDMQVQLYQLIVNTSGEVVMGEPMRFGFLAQSRPVELKGWGSLIPALSDVRPDGSFLMRVSARGTPEDASVNLQLTSDRLGFHLPEKPEEPAKAAETTGTLSSLSLEAKARKRAEKVEASGTLNIGKGKVMSVPFERFLSRVRGSQDQVDLSGLEVRVFRGQVRGTGRYRMKTGDWSFKPVLKNIAVEDVLDNLTDYKNLFSGRLSGTFQAKGRSKAGGKGKPTVTGSFRLDRGELKNFNLVGDVVQALLNLQNVAKLLGGIKGEVSEHASTKFDALDGSFRFVKETLTLKSLHFHNLMTSRSTDSDALFHGSAALDSGLLDLKGKVILSPRDSAHLAREADVLRALLNAEKRMVFPLTLKGRIQKPVPFLDTQYVAGAITRYYARKGLEEGLGKLQKELGLPPGGKGKGEKPVEDLLRQLFK